MQVTDNLVTHGDESCFCQRKGHRLNVCMVPWLTLSHAGPRVDFNAHMSQCWVQAWHDKALAILSDVFGWTWVSRTWPSICAHMRSMLTTVVRRSPSGTGNVHLFRMIRTDSRCWTAWTLVLSGFSCLHIRYWVRLVKHNIVLNLLLKIIKHERYFF